MEPFHTWHIDHLGPFCKSAGFSYIFTIVDLFTKFLFAWPTKSTKAHEVIYSLKDLFFLFGVPKKNYLSIYIQIIYRILLRV